MSDVNPNFYERVRYTVMHANYGNIYIEEPIGWDEDEKEYARNKTYDGIFPKFSNALKFIGNGRDYIKNVRAIYGINAKIRLIKEYLDRDLIWQRRYTGFLDMAQYKEEDNRISIKFHSGGLESVLKARKSSKFELERLEALNGITLEPLNTVKLKNHGRRIYLKSQFNYTTASNQADVLVESNAGNTRNQSCGLPLNLFSKSHDFAQSVIPQTNGTEDNGSASMMFYLLNDRDRIFNISLAADFAAYFQQYENIQWAFLKTSLVIYNGGSNYNVKTRITLNELNSGAGDFPADYDAAYPAFTKYINVAWEGQIELLQDESLGLELLLKSDMYVDNNAGIRVYANNITGFLNIEEDSYYKETVSPGVMVYECFERLVEIWTGYKSNFKSDYFGRTDIGYPVNGPGAFNLVNHGHWIRGFTSEEDLYKPLSTSFKEAHLSVDVPFNIGVGVERVGFRERIIIEPREFFYQPHVLIRIGELDAAGIFVYTQAQKVKRKEVEDWYYSSTLIGSERGGEYEEVMGLEETNTSANHESPIFGVVGEYAKICKWRFDTYGQEIIRRRGIETHPTTDQSGDSHAWLNSVKPGPDNIYEFKRWDDVLQAPPVGYFDYESGYNFEFSPVNCLLKHGWLINSGFTKNNTGLLSFGSSRGNSRVSMQLNGQNEYNEAGDIPIADLQRPRFVPEEIEFEAPVSIELQKQIEGHTVIDNKKIPNFYGMVEFLNESGQIERGYILSIKPNKAGKWKLLKAFR